MDQRLLRRRRARKRHKKGFSKLLQDFRLNSHYTASYRRLAYDQLKFVILPLLAFFKYSTRVFKRCTNSDRHEFRCFVFAIVVGLFIIGFLGFIIKLLHIPITNIIMG
ncbi:protein transport protein Sec61 subunit gamma [Drosophila innubila]|uniref:protein transport protein Sec61 subunit gamma n=1 Tax=Drosophila innubila TaxID=198719 RepID=UPI00148D9158|nr:protein transport protein Sec61 subunit gamma [Drosophila innubila]